MTGGGQPCYRCGKEGHVFDKCFFKKHSCRKCGKQGHIAKVCRQGDKKPYDKKPAYQPREKSTFKKGQHKNQFISADQPTSEEPATSQGEWGLFALFTTSDAGKPTSEEPATSQGEWGLFALFTTSDAGIKVDMELNGTNVSMILDTGASVTLISRKIWKEKFPNLKLDKSEVLLKNLLRRTTPPGVRTNSDARGLQATEDEVTFIDCSRRCRNWLKSIKLDWKEIKHVTVQAKLDFLLYKYSVLFQNELETMSGIEAKLSVKSDAVPKLCLE